MGMKRVLVAACLTVGVVFGVHAQQGAPAATQGARGQGGAGRASGPAGSGAPGQLIGGSGTVAMNPVDARGWGWQVKAAVNPATPRPFYNKAKELLFQD